MWKKPEMMIKCDGDDGDTVRFRSLNYDASPLHHVVFGVIAAGLLDSRRPKVRRRL